MDSTEGISSESLRNFVPDRSDMESVATSDTCGGDIDTDGMTTTNETDQEMKEVSQDNGLDTESSMVELEINKKTIVYHSVDTDSDTGNGKKDNGNNQSTSTDKIFTSFQSGDMMSIPSASEFNGGDSPETIELSSDCTSEKTKESEATEPTDKQQNSTVTLTDLKEDAVSTEPAEDHEDKVSQNSVVGDAPDQKIFAADVLMAEKETTVSQNSAVGDALEEKTSAADVPMAEKEMTVSQNSPVGGAPEQKIFAADVQMTEKEMTVSQNSVVGDAPEQKMSAADVRMAEKEMTVSQNSVVCDAPEQKLSAADVSEQKSSAADVPVAEKEMTVSQNSVVGNAPEQKVSAADVPTPDVPNIPCL